MPVIRKKPGQRPIFPDVPIYLDVGEEGAQRGGVVAPVLFVVSPDLEVAGFGRVRVVEAAEQVVDGGVGDVGEALLQVVFQGALVDEELRANSSPAAPLPRWQSLIMMYLALGGMVLMFILLCRLGLVHQFDGPPGRGFYRGCRDFDTT